jgi:hypothetical protein
MCLGLTIEKPNKVLAKWDPSVLSIPYPSPGLSLPISLTKLLRFAVHCCTLHSQIFVVFNFYINIDYLFY